MMSSGTSDWTLSSRLGAALALLLLMPGGGVGASDATEASDAPEYSRRGADTCLACHDAESDQPVLDIFMTPHGSQSDPGAPMAGLQCETCHGPGGDHSARVRAGEERPPMPQFSDEGTPEDADAANEVCLDCHDDQHRADWAGSDHGFAELACSDCHQIHAVQDPMVGGFGEVETCMDCHQDVRSDFMQQSSHPVRQGLMACTDCHAPHGTADGSGLVEGDGNDTCYSCHAEKRGPMLWEHAPVSEDCALCHNPHGSVNPAMLVQRPPLLCQSCHSSAGHPSLALTGAGLPTGNPSAFLLGTSCLNCHAEVHGSNHPAGEALNR
jgi:DmsE family decaheme c-type cytochrome